jgi:hypothetical protein
MIPSVDNSLWERSSAWSAAGAAIMVVAGGAAGVLWFVASRSHWQLALAVLSTVVAGIGLYWMLATLVPSWWFPLVKIAPAETDSPNDIGPSIEIGSSSSAVRRPVRQPISHEKYEHLSDQADATGDQQPEREAGSAAASVAHDIGHSWRRRSSSRMLVTAGVLAVVIAAGVIAMLRYGLVAYIVVPIAVVLAALRSIRIVPQGKTAVVERFGRYHRTLNPGLSIIAPFADRLRPLIDLRQQVVSFPPQPVLTKDSVVVHIDVVVYFKVIDAEAAMYTTVNYIVILEQLTFSRLRTLVSGMDLETALASRDRINHELRRELDEASGKWGVGVGRVELKAIKLPPPMQAPA